MFRYVRSLYPIDTLIPSRTGEKEKQNIMLQECRYLGIENVIESHAVLALVELKKDIEVEFKKGNYDYINPVLFSEYLRDIFEKYSADEVREKYREIVI